MFEIPYMQVCSYTWSKDWFNFWFVWWNPYLDMILIWYNQKQEEIEITFREFLNHLTYVKNETTWEEFSF